MLCGGGLSCSLLDLERGGYTAHCCFLGASSVFTTISARVL